MIGRPGRPKGSGQPADPAYRREIIAKWRWRRAMEMTRRWRLCFCGVPFFAKQNKQKACSAQCQYVRVRARVSFGYQPKAGMLRAWAAMLRFKGLGPEPFKVTA